MVFFSGNHESRQIGCVDSEKHHRKQGPDTGHEPQQSWQSLDEIYPALGGCSEIHLAVRPRGQST